MRFPDACPSEREQLHRRMFSDVAHDIKTPLATMIGALEIYQRMAQVLPDEKKHTLVTSALTEAYRLHQLMTHVLEMGKFESMAVQPQPHDCYMPELIEQAIAALGARSVGATITVHPEVFRGRVRRDGALLTRALTLLLENAITHAGPAAIIHITCTCDTSGTLQLSVRDQGAGIPDSMLEAIFAKYTQCSAQNSGQKGLGLGLAICRAIMTCMGGEVRADHAEGGGALFTLSLDAQVPPSSSF